MKKTKPPKYKVGDKVKVLNEYWILEKHGLDDRRDAHDDEFEVTEVTNMILNFHDVHSYKLNDKDDLDYPEEVLIKVNDNK